MVLPASPPCPSEIATQRPSTHCQRTLSPASAVVNRHGTYSPVTDIGPGGGWTLHLRTRQLRLHVFPRRSIVAQSATLWYTFHLCHEHQRALASVTDATTPPPSNFIREHIIADKQSRQVRRARRHALSARAERLPAHRPRQGDLRRLRAGARVRRHLQPALRRHQPDHRGRRVRRRHPGGHPLARLRVGRRSTTRPTTSSSSTSSPRS